MLSRLLIKLNIDIVFLVASSAILCLQPESIWPQFCTIFARFNQNRAGATIHANVELTPTVEISYALRPGARDSIP